MMQTQESVFRKLRALKPNYPNLKRLRVFGSVVKGTATKESDVDVLVDFRETPSLFDLGGMVADFEESLGCRVDIVMADSLIPELRDIILNEAVDVG